MRGELLGEFRPNDKILIIQQSGKLKVITPELSTRFGYGSTRKWVPKSQFQLFIMMEKNNVITLNVS
jgi:hypothetical protein